MKKKYKTSVCIIIVIISALLTTSCMTFDTRNPDQLSEFIDTKLQQAGIPGTAVSIIRNNKIDYSRGFGYADIEKSIEASPYTLFMIASISKTVTAAAFLTLYDKGLVDLDDDINRYLPFPVRNPFHPEEPITFRMLLTHTSSIRDNWEIYDSLYTLEKGGDSPISLEAFSRGYLTEEGNLYQKRKNFYRAAPGMKFGYSNCGFALLGYCIEEIAGMPFNIYCRKVIFNPLDMEFSAWLLAEISIPYIAMPYGRDEKTFQPEPIGHYGFATYPDGQLRTSVLEYSKFLLAVMNGGEYKGTRILSSETAEEMLRIQHAAANAKQALAWQYISLYGRKIPSHSGGDPGVLTMTAFDPEGKSGFVIFSNSTPQERKETKAVFSLYNKLIYSITH